MIARCWRGRTTEANAPLYEAHFRSFVMPLLKTIPGFIDARVFRRPHAIGVEFMVITEWAAWDAIRAFAGPRPDVAVVDPDARAVLADYDEHVDHYEEVTSPGT